MKKKMREREREKWGGARSGADDCQSGRWCGEGKMKKEKGREKKWRKEEKKRK